MLLNDTLFPLLEWTGYKLGEQPDGVPFRLNPKYKETLNQMLPLRTFVSLFDADVYAGNSLRDKLVNREPLPRSVFTNRNLYLTPPVAERLSTIVATDTVFAQSMRPFFGKVPSGAGTILFDPRLQYTYRIINADDVLGLHTGGFLADHQYLPDRKLVMVGVFQGSLIVGFEWAYLEESGEFMITNEGYYHDPSDMAGKFVYFCLMVLTAYITGNGKFIERRLKMGEGINKSRQPIIVLSEPE